MEANVVRPNCACVHPDAYECLRLRYRNQPTRPGDMCECDCHYKDQDGYTDWDDRDKEPPNDWP